MQLPLNPRIPAKLPQECQPGFVSKSSAKFAPSHRAIATFSQGPAWDLMQRVAQKPRYDPELQPDGIIDLSGALNSLMDDWMRRYVADYGPDSEDTFESLRYGSISGSKDLREAAAGFFNHFFYPYSPVAADHILATNGVTALIDLLIWTLCDPGDAVLYPTPNFYMLDYDLTSRSEVVTVPVSTTGLGDTFTADGAPGLIKALEASANAADSSGHRPRVLFICNPANPQGRCYSSKTLNSLASWCQQRGMNLVIDEIYAMSQFRTVVRQENELIPTMDTFSSALGIPSPGENLENVYCLYGMSKDFNMGGIRLGFLVTRNALVRAALSRVTWFTWITASSANFAARFLSQTAKVEDYVTTYQARLASAYHRTALALDLYNIPFEPSNAGLFIYIDLSRWLKYLPDSQTVQAHASPVTKSKELQLCDWLIDGGVFLNAGEFAGSDLPGHFRLVFTEFPDATEVAVKRLHTALLKLEQQSGSR